MQKRVRLLFTPPYIVEGMLALAGAVEVIKGLDDIVYAGGPLGKSAGDQRANLTRVSPICKEYPQNNPTPVSDLLLGRWRYRNGKYHVPCTTARNLAISRIPSCLESYYGARN